MKKFIPLLFITLFFSIQLINAQNAPVSTIGNVATSGTTALVPITVTGFTNIGGCDLLFNYDPAIATATSVTLGPGIGQYFFGVDIGTPGKISITWVFWQLGIPGQSLPDNSVFLNITFEKANYGYSAIEFDQSLPDNCLWADDSFNELNDNPNSTYYVNGSVTFLNNIGFQLDLKVFLEGPFSISEMGTSLNSKGFIPLSQPFNTPPWNYTGTESVSSIPNLDVVDWVLVELRDTSEAALALPGTVIARKAGFLLKNGSVVGLDGASNMIFSESLSQNLFAVVIHRNHLSVMSSEPLTLVGGVYSWDFTDELSKAYLDGQKQIGSFVFGMIGGDAVGNGTVGTQDINMVWKPDAGKQDYLVSDLNLDSQVSNQDKNDIWLPNSGAMSMVPTSAGFTCGSPFTDTRDGQSYYTVQIGTQCWMSENMNIGTMLPGNSNQQNNSVIEKYCYNNNTANCDVYGGLYQWHEMMQYEIIEGSQGICPDGWHIPADAEYTALTDFLGGESVAGGKMKESGFAHWNSPNTGATNQSGFTALPGDYRNTNGSFSSLGNYAFFWSSTESTSVNAWYRRLYYNIDDVYRVNHNKNYGFSVRCLQDN